MKVRKKIFWGNIIICIISGFFLIVNFLAYNISQMHIAAVIFIILGIYLIFATTNRYETLFNPYTCFYLIWLVFIPITSFKYPLMDNMSIETWNFCLIGNIAISLALLLSDAVKCTSSKGFLNSFKKINGLEIKIYYLLLTLAVFFLVLRNMLYGIGIFSDTVKFEDPFLGYSLVTTLGSLSVFCLYQSKQTRKKRIFWFLTVCYFFLLLVSGIRWTLILTIIMLLSSVHIDKKNIKYILLVFVVMFFIFMFANYFRKGSDIIKLYYVDTGLYKGDITVFFFTELFRYFGMCQRLITEYVDRFNPGYTHGLFTFYPFIKWFVSVSLPNNIMINGYNALNIMGYLWCDFGYFWPIALFIFYFSIGVIFKKHNKNKQNLFYRYLWAMAFMAGILSFYCYLQHYIYWITVFPVMIILIKTISSIKKQGGELL